MVVRIPDTVTRCFRFGHFLIDLVIVFFCKWLWDSFVCLPGVRQLIYWIRMKKHNFIIL